MRQLFIKKPPIKLCLRLLGHHKGYKPHFTVYDFPYDADGLAHRKSCQNSADAETVQMSEAKPCHTCCYNQTDDIKTNFDLRISDAGNLRQFPWK